VCGSSTWEEESLEGRVERVVRKDWAKDSSDIVVVVVVFEVVKESEVVVLLRRDTVATMESYHKLSRIANGWLPRDDVLRFPTQLNIIIRRKLSNLRTTTKKQNRHNAGFS
jgi:hypothetical protein